MKILLIGSSGQLGSDFLHLGRDLHKISAPPRSELDLANLAQIHSVVDSAHADLLFNAAAFHNVPQCETEPERAFHINSVAVGELAKACHRNGTRLITFSTNYVFDGKKRLPYLETDVPFPLQTYGVSKLAGELLAMAHAPEESIVIRTCGLYGAQGSRSKGGNFVDNRLRDGRNGPLSVRNDQIVCPTSTEDLSRALLQMIALPKLEPGIYHLVNSGECSWFALTQAIFEITGIGSKLDAAAPGERQAGMRRPLYSVLANRRAKALGIELPHWKEALRRYLSKTAVKRSQTAA